MTQQCDNNESDTRLTPDTVNERLTLLTRAENALPDLLAVVLSAIMKNERRHHLRS